MRPFGLALLLLSACLAITFAEGAGEVAEGGNRRLLASYHGPSYPKQCEYWGTRGNGKELAKCCYQHGYKDKDYIYKICQGWNIQIDITIIVNIVIGYSGPTYPKQCYNYGYYKQGKELSECCYKYGVTDYYQIYKICQGFKIQITIDIIEGYFKPKYTGPDVVPDQCTQYDSQDEVDQLVTCCYKYGVHEPETIYDICDGYSLNIEIYVIINIIKNIGYRPAPPPFPPQCAKYANKGKYRQFVKCCKKLNKKPETIVVYLKEVTNINVDVTVDYVESVKTEGAIEDVQTTG